ncbi:TetR/AcrR family transcriptional regulator [Phyllobacterium sp. A18/5-2]|uniref:TetR/AcrR family transcriptional regulator n=1 Tax=Phyllobacterium sp. A18/5-2 TaxID=2978392 RepID=UPI0021C6E70B|nr:TetR/AcrR family transcriptional regulator [Phyllobacterium sp. A18/5-2]UXN65499.1 TetR/AcrR family transcriptional regulator [Phyllobacterium sp. A18/5-2]
MSSTLTQKMSDPGDAAIGIAECSDRRVPPRDRIITSAIELFRQHGIKGIGVDAIADAADSNKMTLYRHFGSKDDLVCECLRQVSARGEQTWRDLENAYPQDPMGQLHGWVQQAAEGVFDDPHGCDLANAAVELKEASHPAHKVIMEAKKAHMERLSDLCRRAGIEQHERLADALVLLAEGARVCRQSVGSNGPQQRLKQTCEAMIAAFSPKP